MKQTILILVSLFFLSVNVFSQDTNIKSKLEDHLKLWQNKEKLFTETSSGLNNEQTILIIQATIGYLKTAIDTETLLETTEMEKNDALNKLKESIKTNTELIEKYKRLVQDYNKLVDKYNRDIKK